MTVNRADTPVRVRQVSAELRQLRRDVGLRAEEVAAALGFSLSKLSRMENGHRTLRCDDVAALLGLYRVPTQRRDELLQQVRSGHERNWWQAHNSHLPATWRDLMRFETEAVAIYNWELAAIPGLLQTDEYAEAIIRGTHSLPDSEIKRLVDARIGRRCVLAGVSAPTLHALLDETSLRRHVGEPSILCQQLGHIVKTSQRSNVTVQVVPFDAGVHPGIDGAFAVLEFHKQRTLVYEATGSHDAFLEEPEHVVQAKQAFRRLRTLAFSPEDSVDFIRRIADEMT